MNIAASILHMKIAKYTTSQYYVTVFTQYYVTVLRHSILLISIWFIDINWRQESQGKNPRVLYELSLAASILHRKFTTPQVYYVTVIYGK